MTMLLVEDDPKRLKELKRHLESDHLKVVTAEDGRTAFLLMRQHKFDLVLSDVNLPFWSGYALVENMRNDIRMKDIPFVMYSSMRMSDENKELAIEAGTNRFIEGTEPEEIGKEVLTYIETI